MRNFTKYGIGVVILMAVFIGCGFVVGRVLTTDNNKPSPVSPLVEKSTETILKEIRSLMLSEDTDRQRGIQAYIIPSVDSHQSEYIAVRDKRREYVTKFTGSAGTAIVTETEAALWVDSRYHLQADMQVNASFWTVMKQGVTGTPSQVEWLKSVLSSNSHVGTDPFLMSSTDFAQLSKALATSGHILVSVSDNLVDKVWDSRPSLDLKEIEPLDIKYSGKSITEKIVDLRSDMESYDGDALIVTALDDIAWLLNLRSNDIIYNPVFFSYVIVTKTEIILFIHDNRITSRIIEHFTSEGVAVTIKNYEEILNGIMELINGTIGKILIPSTASEAIYKTIPEDRRNQVSGYSLIALRKAIKNSVEAEGLRQCHIRDAAALIRYLHWLDTNVGGAEKVTEISGANKLEKFRSEQELFKGLSFESISSFGSNAAIVHYAPTEETDREITRSEIYLIDSGGQYLDGTTDVTRTIHLGEPTAFEKETFTRVLKGFLAIDSAIFPKGAPGSFFDALARKSLWDVGLDYGHGTGHGIGSFLGVHEYPPSISATSYSPGAAENMFTSNEPGYYEAGAFGIRHENIVQVVRAENIAHDFAGKGAYNFYSVTLVPIQIKMINVELLTTQEINHLNNYHDQIRELVGGLLQEQGFDNVYKWLLNETTHIVVFQK